MAIPAEIIEQLTPKQIDLVSALAQPNTSLEKAAKQAHVHPKSIWAMRRKPAVEQAVKLVKAERLDKASGAIERLQRLCDRAESRIGQLLEDDLTPVEAAGLYKTLQEGLKLAREQGLDKHELTQAEARLTLSPVRIRAAVRGARLALRYGKRALDRLARLEAAL